MTADDTSDPLVSREEEQEARELSRSFQASPDEYEAMADRFRERVVDFVLEASEVAGRLAEVRHEVIGADLYPVDVTEEEPLQPLRMGEVAIYDYEADVLLSVIVDLRATSIERVEEYGSVQPMATLDERDGAVDLAREYLDDLEARVSPLHVSLPEDDPRHGHRILEVVFTPDEDGPGGPITSVFVDLSREEIVEDAAFPMLE